MDRARHGPHPVRGDPRAHRPGAPLAGRRTSAVTPPQPSLGDEPIDAVLLSHLHSDHADRPSLRQRGRATSRCSSRRGRRSTVRRLGVRNVHEVARRRDGRARAGRHGARGPRDARRPAVAVGEGHPVGRLGGGRRAAGVLRRRHRRVRRDGDGRPGHRRRAAAGVGLGADDRARATWVPPRPPRPRRSSARAPPSPSTGGRSCRSGSRRRHGALLETRARRSRSSAPTTAPETEVVVLRPTETLELPAAPHAASVTAPAG